MSQLHPNVQSEEEMKSLRIGRLVIKVHEQLHTLKMKAIKEFYDGYGEDMSGCLWELSDPANPGRELVWIPINHSLVLPPLNGWPTSALERLEKKLKYENFNLSWLKNTRTVRVKCLNSLQYQDYENGFGFCGPRFDCNFRGIHDRLLHTLERACGKRLLRSTDQFDPRNPPSFLKWKFSCYQFPNSNIEEWTPSEISECHMALDGVKLRVELLPDPEWVLRCLRSSIFSKLSCTTDLNTRKRLSINDVKELFLRGPKLSGWRWAFESCLFTPNLVKALQDVDRSIGSRFWSKKRLLECDNLIEKGMLKLEPIDSTCRDFEIGNNNIGISRTSQDLSVSKKTLAIENTMPIESQTTQGIGKKLVDVSKKLYEELLSRRILETKKFLEEQHTVQITALNLEMSKVSDELANNWTIFRSANDEKEKVATAHSALQARVEVLRRELDECNSSQRDLFLANQDLCQRIENTTKEKYEAEANAKRWKEKCDAKHEAMVWNLGILNTMLKDITAQRLELEYEKKEFKEDVSQLCAGKELGTMNAQTSGQLVYQKVALQDNEFSQPDVFTGIKQAHLQHILLVREIEYNRGLKDGQSTQVNKGTSQVLSATAIVGQELPSLQSKDKEQKLHERIVAKPTELGIKAPDRPKHPPVQATLAPKVVKSFNVEYEIGLLPQSLGYKILPSKLSLFNHTFLKQVYGGGADFWNNMELAMEIGPPHDMYRNRILKIHSDSQPGVYFGQRPIMGQHGALLLIHGLDDNSFGIESIPTEGYPTFLNTVQGHAMYVGNYTVTKQHVNHCSEHLFGLEFREYLSKDESNEHRFIEWFQKETGADAATTSIGLSKIVTAFKKGVIRTSWTVLEFVGFDLEHYEGLLKMYAQIQPFCNRGKGIPLKDVQGGFQHLFLNELLGTSTKRVHDIENPSESERKRLKAAQQDEKQASQPQESEDELTIVVDTTPRTQ
ncbi:hypothetical protein BELL_0004g00120 [Botrytis elliptica]|uniref:Uncharacterized protein n=1 Tax=Botrytis elliptica TaxID=278938 RepID=A0A4Z1K4Y6_9HELO|nr:hypothetical protein BELL_0004g00120 [Botrytis elliptica]